MDDGFGTDLKNKKILIIFAEMDDWSEEDKRQSVLSVEELVKELMFINTRFKKEAESESKPQIYPIKQEKYQLLR